MASGEIKKKKSIFASEKLEDEANSNLETRRISKSSACFNLDIHDLAGLSDDDGGGGVGSSEHCDPRLEPAATPEAGSRTSISAFPMVYHPTPLLGSVAPQSLFLDQVLILHKMVELAAAAHINTGQNATPSCPSSTAGSTWFLPSPPHVPVLPQFQWSPTPGPAAGVPPPPTQPAYPSSVASPNNVGSPLSLVPPSNLSVFSGRHGLKVPCHMNSSGVGSPSKKAGQLADGSFMQLPAHPPSSINLIAGGKSASRQAPRFQCPDCNRSYSTFSGLSKHRQFHCTSQLKRQFSCKFCDKQYSSLGALKMHIRTHTLPCKCQMCGKAFSRPWLLQGHLRTHTGEKPFRCGHCGRAFADRSNLRAHLQTHSEIKKYCCKTCQKTFSRMSLLTKHENNGCPGLLI